MKKIKKNRQGNLKSLTILNAGDKLVMQFKHAINQEIIRATRLKQGE